jgi:hypothetical protein
VIIKKAKGRKNVRVEAGAGVVIRITANFKVEKIHIFGPKTAI